VLYQLSYVGRFPVRKRRFSPPPIRILGRIGRTHPGVHTAPFQTKWSGKRDSNPRPSAWKADALATELLPLITAYPYRHLRMGSFRYKNWWRGEGSNLRRLRRQIYSLLPLTAREPLHDNPFDKCWSWRWDLNPQPADYKSAALPIELRQRS
jgi:hypothetical protein